MANIYEVSIHFEGPYTFTEGDRCLFTSNHAKSEGVYLWTFRQKRDDSHLIHYIGETSGFARRQAEHLVFILGLYYGVFDPDEAAEGRCVRVFDGLWRDRSPAGVSKVLAEYKKQQEAVDRYISGLEVFIAPTTLDPQERKNIEGWIGSNLRENHPEAKVLYPDDNRVTKRKAIKHDSIRITCDSVIRGLDKVIVCS